MKKFKIILVALTMAITSISASMNAQGSAVMEKNLKLNDGSELLYSSFRPPGLKKKEPVPLVIALHWGWDQDKPLPVYFGKSFLTGFVLPAFEQYGAVIVAPDCPSEKWHNETSEEGVLELIDHIKQIQAIDTGQVFITGFSAGGMGTWYMASRHPEKFSMAIPVASKPYEQWVRDWKRLPVFIVNGTRDELFPFGEVKTIAEELESMGVPVKLIRVEGATHYDTSKFISSLRYSLTWFREQFQAF